MFVPLTLPETFFVLPTVFRATKNNLYASQAPAGSDVFAASSSQKNSHLHIHSVILLGCPVGHQVNCCSSYIPYYGLYCFVKINFVRPAFLLLQHRDCCGSEKLQGGSELREQGRCRHNVVFMPMHRFFFILVVLTGICIFLLLLFLLLLLLLLLLLDSTRGVCFFHCHSSP